MPSFFSVARHPGQTGTWFYSRFFSLHGLDNSYTAIGADDIGPVIGNFVRDDTAQGLSVSMPFKKSVLSYLDRLSAECQEHDLCNTVVKQDGRLVGHNCDHAGARYVISMIKDPGHVMLLGNGAIGSMLASMLHHGQPTVVARNLGNWESRHGSARVLINATGAGTSSGESPISFLHPDVEMVIDLAMKPGGLAKQCKERGIRYVDGLAFYRYQFAKQYNIYTGIDIGDDQLDDAIHSYRKLFLS